MVAGHDDHLRPRAEPRPDRAQDRIGRGQRVVGACLEQLDDVAQQHEAVHAVQRVEQRLERGGPAQHGALQAISQVEIRDHERAHPGYVGHP